MTIRAGHCTDCGVATWRFLAHPVSGETHPLWPLPSTRHINAVEYCAACQPEAEHLHRRLQRWKTEDHGVFLRAWVAEEFKTDPAALLRQWEADRQEALSG